jgi:methylglutaconyl-CoA hydratase
MGALRVERDGPVLRVTLARPERRNAFDAELIAELTAHGYALGGGSGLVACADVAIAARDATFGFTEVRLGIIPAVISPFVLPKIGSAARRYFLTGERFGAEVALRIGLVHEVAEETARSANEIVEALLAGGPQAVREAKQLVRDQPTGLDTARIAAARRTSDEGQDGLRAFLDKRKPRWAEE